MKKTILCMLVGKRHQTALRVQELLTEAGCMIKTRLGIHDGVLDQCSEAGCIILELVGEPQQQEQLQAALQGLSGVTAKLVTLEL